MAQQQQQQQQGEQTGSGSGADFFWAVAVIAVLCIILWVARAKYLPYVASFKMFELDLVSKFTPVSDATRASVSFLQNNPDKVSLTQLNSILTVVNNYFKYPQAMLLFLMAIFLYLNSVGSKFKTTYTMAKLLEDEKNVWPQIIPQSKESIIDIDINKGPWASSLTPMLFAQRHNIIQAEKKNVKSVLENQNQLIATINETKTQQVFAEQLGPLWQGPDRMTMQHKALFAVFAARINGDRDAAQNILDKINLSLRTEEKPVFESFRETFDKYKQSKKVQKIYKKHAYVSTVMSSMLEEARNDGVLACADFLWLKLYDRQLWYTLSNVGRKACFPETAGVFGHWNVEKRIGRPLISPMVEDAVRALKEAMQEIIYDPENNPYKT